MKTAGPIINGLLGAIVALMLPFDVSDWQLWAIVALMFVMIINSIGIGARG